MPPGNNSYPLSIILRAIDLATGPVSALQKRIDTLNAPVTKVSNRLSSLLKASGYSQVATALSDVKDKVADVVDAGETGLKRLAVVTGVATGAAYLFKREFVDVADSLQRFGLAMTAIEKGNRELARTDIAFIESLKTPFQLGELFNDFKIMRAQGLDPLNGQLKALVDYISKIGGSDDLLQRMALELGHASSMGKLQSQQARALAREGIPVWDLLARAVERVTNGRRKLTEAQLIGLSEKGALGKKAIALLIEQMEFESKGMAEVMATRTFGGLLNVIRNRATKFIYRIMRMDDLGQAIPGGPMARLQSILTRIDAWIDRVSRDGRLDAWAMRISSAIENGFAWLQRNGPGIIARVVDEATRLWRMANVIADAFGGWGNLISFGLAAYIGGPLVVAVVSLTASIVGLGIALEATPFGWVITALSLLVIGAAMLGTTWGAVASFIVKMWDGVRLALDGLLAFVRGDFSAGITRAFKGIGEVISSALAPIEWIARGTWRVGSAIGDFLTGRIGRPDMDAIGAPGASLRLPAPSLNVAGALPFAVGHTRDTNARVTVDFRNAPKGTRATIDPNSTAPIDLSLGYAMVTP